MGRSPDSFTCLLMYMVSSVMITCTFFKSYRMAEREQLNVSEHVWALPAFPGFQMRAWLSWEELVCQTWSVNEVPCIYETCNFYTLSQFSSVAQSCPTLCDPMNRSTQGLPVHHQLPEFTQTHVHRVSDADRKSTRLNSSHLN